MFQSSARAQFACLMLSVFFCYMAMIMPLSSLTVLVTRDWGMSNFMGGVAAGAAFLITILLRKTGGDITDRIGGRQCFLRGSLWYAAGSLVCLGAAVEALPVPARFAILLLGRMLIGTGESLSNVGMASWAVDIMGVRRAGRAFANTGMAMYGSAGVGGQAGYYLFNQVGFTGLIAVSSLCPLIAFAIARCTPPLGPLPEVLPPSPSPSPSRPAGKATFIGIISLIWRNGLPACCHAAGFAVLGAFLSKTFIERGWEHAGMGLSCYGIGLVFMRLFIGHLPDKLGGLPVAAGSAVVEMGGLYLLWLAPGPYWALAGAFITGAGCSMIFPSLGLDITKKTPPRLRGACLSCYNIFIDIAYAFAGPVAGIFADWYGDSVAYLFAALASTAGLGFILDLMRRNRAAANNRTRSGRLFAVAVTPPPSE